MKENKDEAILPCYRDGYGVWHYSDDTHDKVYELNKQMCDLGKTMSDAKLMMDDIVRRAEENIRLYNDNKEYARLVRAAYESKFGKPKEKDIMEEKKTKKMTKAEAFEYLSNKKIDACINEREVQLKLFSLGVVWRTLDSKPTLGVGYLLIDKECHMAHCGDDFDYYKNHHYEEISADDILSIEIVDEKKDRWSDFACRAAKIQETLDDDEVCIITKTNYLTMTK